MTSEREVHVIGAMEIRGNVIDNGRDFAAKLPPGSRYRYHQQVKYTSTDGTKTFDSIIKGLTKPKLAKRTEEYRMYVERKALRFERSTLNGEWMSIISMTITIG